MLRYVKSKCRFGGERNAKLDSLRESVERRSDLVSTNEDAVYIKLVIVCKRSLRISTGLRKLEVKVESVCLY